MREISLTNGGVTAVDDGDFEALNKFSWYKWKSKSSEIYYARTNDKSDSPYLHRRVLRSENHIDHKDRDGLNNRKNNLREASKSQNGCNRGIQANNTSGFKGVSYAKPKRKGLKERRSPWWAKINVNGKLISLGYHLTKEQAALAYDTAARKYFGEFAGLNFP